MCSKGNSKRISGTESAMPLPYGSHLDAGLLHDVGVDVAGGMTGAYKQRRIMGGGVGAETAFYLDNEDKVGNFKSLAFRKNHEDGLSAFQEDPNLMKKLNASVAAN
jgi:hypothetical protein